MGRKLLFMCIVCAAMMTSAFGQAVDSVNCTEPIINKTDWTVSASCVGIVYGEVSQGDCIWIMYQHNTTRQIKWIAISAQPEHLSEERFFWNCSLYHQLPCYNAWYDVYIQFYNGATKQQPAFSIECPTTDPPALDVSCPTYIKEGDPLDCTCRVSNNPQPCPVLSWDDTNDTRTVCGGETQHFHLDHVQRAQHGQQHVCKAKWLNETITKNCTLHVAYGPDNVTIVEIDKKNEAILVRCTASDSVPSASFAWNVSCINTTTTASSSECWLKLDRENEGEVVQCTAHNNVTKVSRSVTYTPDSHAPDTYTFDTDTPDTYTSDTYTPDTTTRAVANSTLDHTADKDSTADNEGVPIMYIAIGAGGGATVVLLGIVVVYIVRRKRKGLENVKFRGGMLRQSTKPSGVAARISSSPAGDDSFIYDENDDKVSSPTGLQAKSAIYSVIASRQPHSVETARPQMTHERELNDSGVNAKPQLQRLQKQNSVSPPENGGPPTYEETGTRL